MLTSLNAKRLDAGTPKHKDSQPEGTCMTEAELIDRLREAIVLDGPEAWRHNGYLQDAQVAGLPLEVALKRANEVSQEVSNNSILFQNIQARIARLAQPSRSQYIEQDLNQIVNAARSLRLSPDFVRNRWVPAELARLKTSSASSEPPSPPATLPVGADNNSKSFSNLPEKDRLPLQTTAVVETVPPIEPVAPALIPELTIPLAVAPTPSRSPEPPPVVRSFTATPARVFKGEPVTLEWEVENLLAVTIDDLGEGLSPKNRGWVKPSKTMEYTLFDVNNNPLSTVRVEVMRRDRSGVYGVLFALALLALIYWFVKSTNSAQKPYQEPERRTERATRSTKKSTGTSYKKRRREVAVAEPTPSPEKPVDKPVVAPPAKSKTDDAPAKSVKETTEPVEKKTALAEPVTKPASPSDARLGKYEEAFGDKPYDKIELGTDERGWRRARSNGRWGFVNEDDKWVIQPEFEAVTPFRGNTAAVFLNGQLININREGQQIRN